MIEPTAISVTGELPEMAAKNMQAMTALTASPPGSQPSAALATATSRRASPPSVMIAPAPMNSGMARNSLRSISCASGLTMMAMPWIEWTSL